MFGSVFRFMTIIASDKKKVYLHKYSQYDSFLLTFVDHSSLALVWFQSPRGIQINCNGNAIFSVTSFSPELKKKKTLYQMIFSFEATQTQNPRVIGPNWWTTRKLDCSIAFVDSALKRSNTEKYIKSWNICHHLRWRIGATLTFKGPNPNILACVSPLAFGTPKCRTSPSGQSSTIANMTLLSLVVV